MRRVYVCSPLRAETKEAVDDNIELARTLCLYAMLLEDVAAFASHAFYTSFLDDTTEVERKLGTEAGLAWLDVADEVWVYTRRGVSLGMAHEIEDAARAGKTILWDPSPWNGLGQS